MSYCPACKKEVDPIPVEPSLRNTRVDKDGMVRVDVLVEDLCPECSETLYSGKGVAERSLKGLDYAVPHLSHSLEVEAWEAKRTMEQPGYCPITVNTSVQCSCGGLSMRRFVLTLALKK